MSSTDDIKALIKTEANLSQNDATQMKSFDQQIRSIMHTEANSLITQIIQQEALKAVDLISEALETDMKEHLQLISNEIASQSISSNTSKEDELKILNEKFDILEKGLTNKAEMLIASIAAEKISYLESTLKMMQQSEQKYILASTAAMEKLRAEISTFHLSDTLFPKDLQDINKLITKQE